MKMELVLRHAPAHNMLWNRPHFLSRRQRFDALHIAVAAVHGMGYLVTWNCTHIANATMRGRIEAICRRAGFDPPLICTPLELVKEQTP